MSPTRTYPVSNGRMSVLKTCSGNNFRSGRSPFVGIRTDPRHLHIGGPSGNEWPRPEVVQDQTTAMSHNGNNVDLDYEMALMAKNQLYYNTLIQMVNGKISKIRTAIDGRVEQMRMGSFDISASALTAQRLRMDVAAANIANADVSRGRLVNGQWVPYQRKMVVLESKQPSRFDQALRTALGQSPGQGVRVAGIVEDRTRSNGCTIRPIPMPTRKATYRCRTWTSERNGGSHVRLAFVRTSVTALNASKAMYMKALEIGR